ncbi:MAG: DeoR/GlpR transcriptional regulator [Clostridia bacterium]|nr:DeoR/GlpR transcriptional regulator [Clostridia bacterium]
MFFEERHEQIVQMLQGGKTISVSELARRLFVSEATVRRDLNVLEKEGIARRVHGGAVLIGHFRDVPLLTRESEDTGAKQKIGRAAASLVRENDVIIMDASSTAYAMIPYLTRFRNIVVVTSGVKTALALGENHIKTYLTGGLMIDNSYSLIGGHTVDFISSLSADILFFSCRGAAEDGRLTDTSVEEAQLRQVMFHHAKRKVFLSAGSKIGRDYFYVLGHANEMDDIICDQPVPEAWRAPTVEGHTPRIWLDVEE